MNEDPVFFKRLSELIKNTIAEYHQQRINEAAYLARVKEHESVFFNGDRDNIPGVIRDNAIAIAFYNLASEELKDSLEHKTGRMDIAVDMALGIESVVKENVFDKGKQVIDWQKNEDIKGKIKIGIDDLLFDLKHRYDLDINFEHVDQLIAESIKVAEAKYKD